MSCELSTTSLGKNAFGEKTAIGKFDVPHCNWMGLTEKGIAPFARARAEATVFSRNHRGADEHYDAE